MNENSKAKRILDLMELVEAGTLSEDMLDQMVPKILDEAFDMESPCFNRANEVDGLTKLKDLEVITQDEFDFQMQMLFGLPSGKNEPVEYVQPEIVYINEPDIDVHQTRLVCGRCGGRNISVQAVSNTYTKHRGCFAWVCWILLAICTVGLIIIIPLITNRKVKSYTTTEAICQNCGFRWQIGKTPKKNFQ